MWRKLFFFKRRYKKDIERIRKKEILGVLKKQTEKIVFYQIGIIIFISLLTSFFAKYFTYYVIDKKIDFINLLTIENILFENMITILLSLIFSFIFSGISKYFVNKIKLSDVLRED